MRLIDADNLLQQIEERIKESGKHRMAVLADELIDIVNDYAEDYENAELVKHGEWIECDNGTFSCSLCQSWIPKEQHYYARYCLHCGAKMDGGADNAE